MYLIMNDIKEGYTVPLQKILSNDINRIKRKAFGNATEIESKALK